MGHDMDDLDGDLKEDTETPLMSNGAGEQPRTKRETELANKRAGKPPRAMMAKRLRDDVRHELQTWATT